MNIEVGELFVVTRGFRCGEMSFAFAGLFGDAPKDKPPSYDRSHEGRVYRAVQICGPVIAAQLVYTDKIHDVREVGSRRSLNTKDVEVWPVTEAYLEALTTGAKG